MTCDQRTCTRFPCTKPKLALIEDERGIRSWLCLEHLSNDIRRPWLEPRPWRLLFTDFPGLDTSDEPDVIYYDPVDIRKDYEEMLRESNAELFASYWEAVGQLHGLPPADREDALQLGRMLYDGVSEGVAMALLPQDAE